MLPERRGGRPLTTKLSRLLRQRGLTNEAVAQATGYTVAAVRSWRSGRCKPGIGAMALLANMLGLTPAVLRPLLDRKPSKPNTG